MVAMLGRSFPEYVFIRVCIFCLQYTTPLCLLVLALLGLGYGPHALYSWTISKALVAYSVADLLYAVFIWTPYNRRLEQAARHPPPLDSAARRALFYRCLENIPDLEHYLNLWFLGADEAEIRRDNVRDFVLWGFFDCDPATAAADDLVEAESYVDYAEGVLGRRLAPGRGNARCLRLTLDKVETRYRSVGWYVIIGFLDHATHLRMVWNGFQYYAQADASFYSVFPFRLQNLFCRRRSGSRELGYWVRPHTSKDKLPVVFLHGIGIGLWTYISLFSRLNTSSNPDDQVGMLAVELLPISFRLTGSPLDRLQFLDQIAAILDRHKLDRFVLASHSYGTVLASHMLQSDRTSPRVRSVVLIDPVSLLLHLPDVAYNFTRRRPRGANEWQLWYFASMDPGVAHTLGRHFFWRENIIWKEGLLGLVDDKASLPGSGDLARSSRQPRRHVAVCLAERDLIVDTVTLAKYLGGVEWAPIDHSKTNGHSKSNGHSKTNDAGSTDAILRAPPGETGGDPRTGSSDIEVLWFPGLDHAQALDKQRDQDRICQVIRRHARVDDEDEPMVTETGSMEDALRAP